ncbi:MAG: hypothetical protein KDA25_02975, partial [Phycisphaerales bacterium]|nr:hypothetical protein [Phycisphaerales bacterium]
MFPLTSRLTVLVSSALLMCAGPVAADPIDWRLVTCELTESAAPDALDLAVRFAVDVGEIPPGAEYLSSIRILFNGVPMEPDHATTVIATMTFGPCTAPAGGVCAQPAPNPCSILWYGYKSTLYQVNARCTPNVNTGLCHCIQGAPPVIMKTIPRPSVDGLIEIILDPDDLIIETDESNNRFEIWFDASESCTNDDGFEAYAPGESLDGQDGWKGWDDTPALAATVTDALARGGEHA